jgi:hypothetical protein
MPTSDGRTSLTTTAPGTLFVPAPEALKRVGAGTMEFLRRIPDGTTPAKTLLVHEKPPVDTLRKSGI